MKRKPVTDTPEDSTSDYVGYLYPDLSQPPKLPFDQPLFQKLVNRAMATNWDKKSREDLHEYVATHYPRGYPPSSGA